MAFFAARNNEFDRGRPTPASERSLADVVDDVDDDVDVDVEGSGTLLAAALISKTTAVEDGERERLCVCVCVYATERKVYTAKGLLSFCVNVGVYVTCFVGWRCVVNTHTGLWQQGLRLFLSLLFPIETLESRVPGHQTDSPRLVCKWRS